MRRESVCFCLKLLVGFLGLSVIALGLPDAAVARETSFWTSETVSDFRAGTPECVSVSSQGIVSLAPHLDTLLSAEESYFWCIVKDGKENLYVSSGDGGKVYKSDSRGRTSLVLDSEELEILSLAVDEKGSVFAGTSPGGLIYRITPDGESSVFFETGESYIWCLVFDEAGDLYAGTGDKGKVYRIRPNGTGDVFYETGERHVMCSGYEDGKLVIGTEGSGLVISISEAGKGRVLYDCDEEEVKDLAVGTDGVIYAAAVARDEDRGEVSTESKAGKLDLVPGERKKQPASIYRIHPDGTALRLWKTSRSRFYSLWLAGDDSLIVGAGDDGTIYCLTDGEVELLHRVAESQVLDILGDDGAFVFCTGNRAKVYSAGPSLCREGTLVSKAFDAVGVSRWGTLDWEADTRSGASLVFQLRTGNSEKPDKTWSDWSKELLSPGQVSEVASARFVQWKAVLRSAAGKFSPALSRVTLSYLERNLSPDVGFVYVIAQGIPFSAGGTDGIPDRVSQTLPGGVTVEYSIVAEEQEHLVEEAAWARTFRTAVWEASDPNGDRLVFSIFYRAMEEENWKLLEEDFDKLIFTWNTASFPDGSYLLRVVGSDSPDNIPSDVLTDESISLPFEVDNTPPVVSNLRCVTEEGGVKISGNLSDNMSPVVGLHYSLDGGEWRRLQSSDGLLDCKNERFFFSLEGLSAGEHSVVIRTRDRAGNIGTGRVRVD